MIKKDLIKYAAIIAPTIAVLIAQILKYIIAAIKGKHKIDYSILAGTGRMPSGHACLTTALLVTYIYKVFIYNESPELLGIALILWYVVLRDAVGVRKEVEKHAKIINKYIIDNLEENKKIKRLSEDQGHTKLEVLVGVLVGIIIPLIYFKMI